MLPLPINFREKFRSLFKVQAQEKIWASLNKLIFEQIYIVGGAIRDALVGKEFQDLDLVVFEAPVRVAKFLAQELGWAIVVLSEEFAIYRITSQEVTIDVCLAKGKTIEEDLKERDFTLNALGISLRDLMTTDTPLLIDPLHGYQDLKQGIIRAISEKNLLEDPLRILRGYRLFAQNYGLISQETRKIFAKHAQDLVNCPAERILHELEIILLTFKSWEAFKMMDEDGVLEVLFPEIKVCKGVPQPSFHHLDVWGHMLESLRMAEFILQDPKSFLGQDLPKEVRNSKEFIIACKLASLFHDLGKGYTYQETEERIVFYGHEKVSRDLVLERLKRLRFKRDLSERIANLVKNHMRPCQLLAEFERGSLTVRAKRRLLKDVPYLWDLFVVCLADSLASLGPEKELDYEERLQKFFQLLLGFQEELTKLEKKERLLTGSDLIALGFSPGPIFSKIMEAIEIKFLEGEIKTKDEAIEFVKENFKEYLSCKKEENKVS